VAIEKRLDEMALRDTGRPISDDGAQAAPYIQAKRSKSGELYDRARSEVELERGVQSLAGFVSQGIRPDAILTPEESQIRQARAHPLVDPAIARTLDTAAEKTPSARADQATIDAVTSAVARIREQTGRDTPTTVVSRLASPTNANLDWVSKQVYQWELEQEPLIRGYGSSGTPEARRIQNDIAAMAHAGQALSPEDRAMRIAANRQAAVMAGQRNQNADRTGPIHAALQIPGQEREAIIAANPLLGEYLAWKKMHPDQEVADFLKEKFGR
jgi:hypothetical protein